MRSSCNVVVGVLALVVVGTLFLASCDSDSMPTLIPPVGHVRPGWGLLYPQPASNDLWSVCSPGEGQKIVVVGGRAAMGISGDQGASWVVAEGPPGAPALRSVDVEGGFGVTVGDAGSMYVSTDAGTAWRESSVEGQPASYRRVDVVSSSVAVVLGADGRVFRTMDAGSSWTSRDVDMAAPYAISFLDDVEGLVVGGQGEARWTVDGGATWLVRDLPSEYFQAYSALAQGRSDALVAGAYAVAGAGETRIYRTIDAGMTWSQVYSTPWAMETGLTASPGGPVFAVVGGGSFGAIVESGDSGETWSQPRLLPDKANDVDASQAGVLVAVGMTGSIMRSEDGGATWKAMHEPVHPTIENCSLMSVWFQSDQLGFIGAAGAIDNGLYRTRDGGRSWEWLDVGHAVSDIRFRGDIGLVGFRYSNFVMRSSDGGATWSRVDGTGKLVWLDISPAGIAVGTGLGGSRLSMSRDGGETWFNVTGQPLGAVFGPLAFATEDVLVIWGENGTYYRSTDGGLSSWEVLSAPSWGRAVDFNHDGSIGLAVGFDEARDPSILRTLDQGITWEATPVTGGELRAVAFADSSTAYVVGGEGTLLRTTDGGLSWVTQESPGTNYYLDAHFPSPETGYLVAAGGVLVKTTSGGDPVP